MIKGIDYIGVAVGAMVFNEMGELFLMKRGQIAKNEKGTWEAPGGGVELGEKLVHAIKREMKEEFDVDVEIIEQLPAMDHLIPDEKQHWVPSTFICKFKDGQKPKICEPEKCEKIGWFALNKLPRPLSLITKLNVEYYQSKNRFKYEYFLATRVRNRESVIELLKKLRDKEKLVYYCMETDPYHSIDDDPEKTMRHIETTKNWRTNKMIKDIYLKDKLALEYSQTLLLLLPAGKSAHLEAGMAYGMGKKCILIGEIEKPESLYLLFNKHFKTIDDFIDSL